MSERVAAVPSRLLTHATISNSVADELRAAAAALDTALDLVRACAAAPEIARRKPGVELAGLAAQARSIGEFVHAVGRAIAAAGAAADHGLLAADAASVDAALARRWHPDGKLTAVAGGAWWRMVWGDRCPAGERFYGGGSSAITGPDGRLYPLVAPSVVIEGKVYNADWGREGSPRVGDLFGTDPGWRVVDVETGVERHRGAPGWFERMMVGIGSTVSGPQTRSTKDQVETVVLEPGSLPRIVDLPAQPLHPYDRTSSPPPETPIAAGASTAHLVLDLSVGALTADGGAHDAYQITFEENLDGRLRASYLRVDVLPAVGSDPTMLVPSFVVGPSVNDRIVVRYLGPKGGTVRDAHPRTVVADPPRGAIPGDR